MTNTSSVSTSRFSSARRILLPRHFSGALVTVALAHLVIEFCNNFMPVLYARLMPVMGLSFAQVGLITLVASTALSFSQPIFGYFSDRWDPVWIVSVSIVWIGIAMGLVGLANSYAALLMLVALGSIGSGAFHPPATVVAAANSGKRRGSGLSVFSVGGNIGTALSPLWMAFALGALGLAGTLTIAPIAGVFGLVFFVLMRRGAAVETVQRPESSGKAASGFLVGMLLVIAAMMFRSWYQVAFTTYLATWVVDTGGSLNAGSRMLAVFLFSISAGSVVGGVSGDRYGHLRVLVVGLSLLPALHLALLHASGGAQVFAIALAGVAVGCTFPTSIVLVLDAWPHQVGVATGLLMGLGWWPGGIGASLTGLLADQYSLTTALMTLAIVPLAGLACLLAYGVAVRVRKRTSTL
jgi:FSR family fosmidomycin resistance protein-like MFS transporter